MNVIISIEGNQAIPVRALPFLAKNGLTTDEVARALMDSEDFPTFKEVRAFHTQNGAPQELPPEHWESVDLALTRLERGLPENSNVWPLESLKLLPAGVFVWRDEWESAYNQSPDGPDTLRALAECADDLEDVAARTLNLSPFVPPELAALVMHGFDMPQAAQAEPVVAAPPAPRPAKTPRKGWMDIAGDHAVMFQKTGRYMTAKAFYDALYKQAGDPESGSPFIQGKDGARHLLVLAKTNKPVSRPTLKNCWPTIREAAKN